MMYRLLKSAVVFFVVLTVLSPSILCAHTAKLAIVIDDLGYQPQEDAAILALPKEISVAIIPSAPYASQINQQAKAQARDILIHMPMQPMSNQRIEAGGLYLGLSQQEVSRRVQQARNAVPDAIGMNNHMGSAATSDSTLMTYLMRELRQQQLFFLDSRTIGSSIAGKIAKEQGVIALTRHIFLDDSNHYEDVYGQFQKSIRYARKHGTAIVIGHPRRNTIAVLQAGLRSLPSDIQLVGMGGLWRNAKAESTQWIIVLFNHIPAPTSAAPFENVPLLRGVPQ